MRACVVGGGLAGAAAAMRLRENGAEVLLVSRASGATALGGGTVDFAATPGPDYPRGAALAESPAKRMGALLARNATHPYHLLCGESDCAARLEVGLQALDGWLGREGLRIVGRADRGLLLCDTQGALRVADAAIANVAAGDLGARDDEVALVAMPGLRGWDARAATSRLNAEAEAGGCAGLRATAVDPRWPDAWLAAAEVPAKLAALLDAPGALPTLAEALRPVVREGRSLLLPPVLGLDPQNPLQQGLTQSLEVPVAECVGVAPLHLAGFRLQSALERALTRAGVERSAGEVAAIDLDVADRSLGVSFSATSEGGHDAKICGAERFELVVLATGAFVGGGLREGAGGVEEAILGLPLFDPLTGQRVDGLPAHALTERDYEAEQALFRVGVAADVSGRVLGTKGVVVSQRLFAAGELLQGFDPALDRSGHGVALLSGIRAGEEASRLFAEASGAAP